MGDNNERIPGQYEDLSLGGKAFIPSLLPPNPAIIMDAGLIDMVASAERALGRLDGATNALPDSDLFVAMYVKREAALSSQIEGTQASLQDLLEYEAEWSRSDRPHDVEDVVNYVAAMKHGLERLESLPLSLRLIREIHARLLSGTRGGQQGLGEFRRVQNWIGAPGSSPETARYVPPPPDKLTALLDNFEKFLHESFPGPALVRIGITHPQFESIHPFLDGNGRVGRLLITFQLCEHGILKRPLLYLSHYFKRYRQEYYDRLQAIRDDGDWEGWLRFFLEGVVSVGEEASQLAQAIVSLHREDHRRVAEASGTSVASALALLDSLYGRPVVSVKAAAEATGLSFANANNLVARFCELGVLREITGRKRDRRFEYSAYLALFAEPP